MNSVEEQIELLQAYASGKEDALAEFIRLQQPSIMEFLFKRFSEFSRDERNEIFWQSVSDFIEAGYHHEKGGVPNILLKRIAKNNALMLLSYKKAQKRTLPPELIEEPDQVKGVRPTIKGERQRMPYPHSLPSPLRLAAMSEVKELVRGLLSQLSSRHREIVRLYYIEDYSFSQVAEMVNSTPGSILMSYLILRVLKQKLEAKGIRSAGDIVLSEEEEKAFVRK